MYYCSYTHNLPILTCPSWFFLNMNVTPLQDLFNALISRRIGWRTGTTLPQTGCCSIELLYARSATTRQALFFQAWRNGLNARIGVASVQQNTLNSRHHFPQTFSSAQCCCVGGGEGGDWTGRRTWALWREQTGVALPFSQPTV